LTQEYWRYFKEKGRSTAEKEPLLGRVDVFRYALGTSYSFSVGGIGDVRQTAFRFKKYHFDEKLNRIVS